MAVFEATDPSTGVTLSLEGDSPPTEAELEEVFASFSTQGATEAAVEAEPSLAETIRGFLPPGLRGENIGEESLGVTARAGIEGVAAIPGIVIDPILNLMERGVRALGREPESVSVSEAASLIGDQLGLPEGEGAGFEVAKGMAGVSPGVAIGRGLAKVGGEVTKRVGSILAETPGVQTVAGATGAAGSEIAEAAGAGPVAQLVAGIAGGMVAPGAVGAVRAVKRAGAGAGAIAETFTKEGQKRIAGEFIADQATDPTVARANMLESLKKPPLTEQTAAVVSEDLGLLTLERGLRTKDTTARFAKQTLAANKKRQDILDVIGGEDIQQLTAQRSTAGTIAREAALGSRPKVNVKPISALIQNISKSPSGKRSQTQRVIDDYGPRIKGVKDAAELYEIRKDIGDDLAGRSGVDRTGLRQASKELIVIRNEIDKQIEKVAPGFRKYLDDYSELSRVIDQQEIIQGIQERASVAIPDPTTRTEVLSQAKFRKAVLKESNKEGIDRKLTDDQLKTLEAIATDLDLGMSFNVAGIRPTGSDTVKNLTTAHIIGRALGGKAESAGIFGKLIKPLKFLGNLTSEEVESLVVDAMLDPKLAAEMLARPSLQNVQKAAVSLRALIGVSGTAGAVSSTQSKPDEN